ncbi:MAG: CPBP family intramembrane metalloprotease [Flavobacteriales bacterium]|nr:CPBP family intramembrane metalloprotease [Flavobacteriales bacterium]MBP9079898.1 CPBP family intramembrane metalloprotease [Flavobacteriales bacterium]
MDESSVPEQPQPDLQPFRPAGLEMARGLLYFSLVFMLFMFTQMAALIWQVLARTPELRAGGISLSTLDSAAFQARWMELGTNGDVLSLVSLAADGACMALFFWIVYSWKRGRTGHFLALRLPSLRALFQWTGYFLLLFAALEGLGRLLPEMDSSFMQKVLSSVTNYPLLILGLGLLPALFEEFLLRGLLYGSLRHLLDKHVSIAIVAGVFTLVHQQYDWQVLLFYVLPLGVFLGYARANTGSIWTSVFLHLLNNVASMLLPHGT